ncbi:hypothetical protein QBC41DRAFT_330496 [Cercophora samala]|uniref:Uncharacterized protein n=1 Tax=Cercophora samala TaxID=330535 RepID=A0AA40D3G5_9PEZI|nr:hypothetical protein QBC41DRAFT_330496 [Cercophora samala]
MSSDPNSIRIGRTRRRVQTTNSFQPPGTVRRRISSWMSSISGPVQPAGHAPTVADIQQEYPCYDLYWEDLERYLRGIWQDREFEERVENDHYVFYTPPPGLTEEQRREIASLRHQQGGRNASESPERPAQ